MKLYRNLWLANEYESKKVNLGSLQRKKRVQLLHPNLILSLQIQYEQMESEKGLVLPSAALDRLEGSSESALLEVPDYHFG